MNDKSQDALCQMSDEDLVMLCCADKDSKAIDVLLNRYSSHVRAIARRFYGHIDDLDDLVSVGMMGLVYAVYGYSDDKGKFRPYANTCIRNKILDEIKKVNGDKHKALNGYIPLDDIEIVDQSSFSDPEKPLMEKESADDVNMKMKKVLSSFEYGVMELYLNGERKAEIAIKFGKSKKSIYNAISRSYKKLKHNLINMGGEGT